MKRFLVTEEEKTQIMGLYQQTITEASEVVNPVKVAMDAKKEMESTGINYNVVKLDDVVDSNDPTCVPQTDDETNNGTQDIIYNKNVYTFELEPLLYLKILPC